MAESAVKLFQDSSYDDLVTFESHIAQISELVLLICEGPGALAELGSFSQTEPIRERLYVILRSDHFRDDSFVRLGPIKVLQRLSDDTAVGAFNWRIDEHGHVDVTSLDGLILL